MSVQTIRELIDYLEELAQDCGDDLPVRIASQPSWPLASQLAAVTVIDYSEKGRKGALQKCCTL